MRRRISGALVAGLLLAGALVAQQRQLKPGFNLFSKEQDIQLGKEAAAQVEREMTVIKDRQLNDYITGIGRKLTSTKEADNYPYTFQVVHDDSINAFALPGGPTFVNTGLIAAAENEAQLAGVMAHEISHVALRHGTNQATKASLFQLPILLAGAAAGSKGGLLGSLAQVGIGLGANSVLLKYSRNAERDADLLGTRIMSAAGYNPIEMARFFEKLEAETGNRSGLAQFLSSHPNPGNRVVEVEKEIRYLPQRQYSENDKAFHQMQDRVRRLGDAPKAKAPAGQAQGSQQPARVNLPDLKPSAAFLKYQGGEFSLSYPDNWQPTASESSVTIAPPAGVVRSQSGGALGYGVIVSTYTPQSNTTDLPRATEELIRQLQSSNPNMRTSGSSRQTRVDGQTALATTLTADSPFGQKEVDNLVTIPRHGGGFYYLVFVAPESEFRTALPGFQKMLESLRFQR